MKSPEVIPGLLSLLPSFSSLQAPVAGDEQPGNGVFDGLLAAAMPENEATVLPAYGDSLPPAGQWLPLQSQATKTTDESLLPHTLLQRIRESQQLGDEGLTIAADDDTALAFASAFMPPPTTTQITAQAVTQAATQTAAQAVTQAATQTTAQAKASEAAASAMSSRSGVIPQADKPAVQSPLTTTAPVDADGHDAADSDWLNDAERLDDLTLSATDSKERKATQLGSDSERMPQTAGKEALTNALATQTLGSPQEDVDIMLSGRAESFAADNDRLITDAEMQQLEEQEQVMAGRERLEFGRDKEQWVPAMGSRIVTMVADNVQQAEIHLDPPELGSMELKLQTTQDQASVQVQVQNPLVRDVLEANAQRLRDALAQQGLELTDFDVSDQSAQQQEQHAQQEQDSQQDAQSSFANAGQLSGAESEPDDRHIARHINRQHTGVFDAYA